MSQEFDNNVLDLVKQKGFYPYEYMNDFEHFKEKLLSKEKFCRSLTNRKINDNKYELVFNVWNKFKMKTMKDYHDLYLKCDVLFLADVFEKLKKKNSFKNYGLFPSHCLSTPGLSWGAMLKMTKLSLSVFQILTFLYFLKKVQEVEFLIFLI